MVGPRPRGVRIRCATRTFHYEDPLTPEPLRRRRARIAKHAQRLWTAFPDARVQRHRRARSATAASPARRARCSARTCGELGGLAADRPLRRSCTRSSTPSCATGGCCASARSSTSTAPPPQLGVLPEPGHDGRAGAADAARLRAAELVVRCGLAAPLPHRRRALRRRARRAARPRRSR